MTRILIDTDVILDFFFDRKPFSDNAAQIISLCESKKMKGYVTPVMISNIYYLLRQTAKHEKVIENLKLLLSITEILEIKRASIIQALNSPFKDFEDALQNYAAESDQIDVIITRNTKDYKNSALGIMTPDNYLKMIAGQLK
ncbi:MAG: putative nucleic acid-binding protein contains domain [Crocinitomicaceae bacterium]|jgi:predicted nucleic acid-binding protein|nr:putative nucleic acid-binding protein contains domain [Crocinitomicaceae bacterium]